MPLLKPIVFPDVMQIITSNNNRTLHLHLLDNAGEDSASNRYVASERAFLIDIRPFNSLNKTKPTITQKYENFIKTPNHI